MSIYTYKQISENALYIKKSVESEYNFKTTPRWSYYIAKAILQPKKDVKGIGIKEPSKPSGDHISRQIKKADYLDMCKRLITYVEKNKQIPNYVTYKSIKVEIKLFTYIIAYLLVHYNAEGKLKSQVNVSSKYFKKPTETPNGVYAYFKLKTGHAFKYIDDFLNYVATYYNYEFYFDDKKSNKQVIDDAAGNCTDLTQMCCNMAEAMDYEWKTIHTECRQSGTGHVYNKFRKKGTSTWFTRDIACIADEGRFCVWCDVDEGAGYKLSENPSWWLENLRR